MVNHDSTHRGRGSAGTGGTRGRRRSAGWRPLPSVSRVSSAALRHSRRAASLITVTQRDDTLLLAPAQARRLARALLRAAAEREGP